MSAAGPSSVPLIVTGTVTRWASLGWSFGSLGFLDSASSTSGRSPTLNNNTLDMPSGETTRMGYKPVGASLFKVTRKGSDELGVMDSRLESADGSLVSVKRENTAGRVDCTRAPIVKFSPRKYKVMVLPRCAPRGDRVFSVGTAACSAHPAPRSAPSARNRVCLVMFYLSPATALVLDGSMGTGTKACSIFPVRSYTRTVPSKPAAATRWLSGK